MRIPATSVTDRHQIRLDLGAGRDTGWLDVEEVIPSADGMSVHFRCGPGFARFGVDAPSMVDARLPEHTFGNTGVSIERIADGDERGDNSTWQGNEVVAVAIRTHLELPPHVANDVDAAAEFIERLFDWLASTARSDGFDLTFDIEVGPDTCPDPSSYATAVGE